jgi:hypothetical protein
VERSLVVCACGLKKRADPSKGLEDSLAGYLRDSCYPDSEAGWSPGTLDHAEAGLSWRGECGGDIIRVGGGLSFLRLLVRLFL